MSEPKGYLRKWITAFVVVLGLFSIAPILLSLTLFGPVTLLIPYSWYSVWLRGYSTVICDVHTRGDVVSPSGRWTARIERSEGCDFGEGPWVDVALIPNDRPRFLARHRWVFYRALGGVKPGSNGVAIKWIDDYSLEVSATPCAPACRRWDDAAKGFVPTGADPCETACVSPVRVANITVVISPPEN